MGENNTTRLAGMMVLGLGAVAAGSLLRMAWLRREILRSVNRLGEMTTAAVERQVALRSLANPDRNLKAAADQLRLLETGVTAQVSIARKNHQRHSWLVSELRKNWAVRTQFLPQWRANAFESLDGGVEAHRRFLETLEQQTAAAQKLIARIRQT